MAQPLCIPLLKICFHLLQLVAAVGILAGLDFDFVLDAVRGRGVGGMKVCVLAPVMALVAVCICYFDSLVSR